MLGNQNNNPSGTSARPPVRVLLVDDQEEMLVVGHLCLRQLGYHPLTASNGPQALDIVASEVVDLVLLDLNMPGMDGIETLKGIVALKPKLPVVFSTGYALKGWESRLGEEKPAGVLKKPYTPEELQQEIRRVLEVAGRED